MSGSVYDKSALRNYYPMPNQIFSLGLKPGELAVYSYLMFCENRRTFQCYPSYETIGKWTGMTKNTVAKYVRSLEDKRLIATRPTTVPDADGIPRNGTLCYTILPVSGAVKLFYARQMENARAETAKQSTVKRLEAFARCSEQGRTVTAPTTTAESQHPREAQTA